MRNQPDQPGCTWRLDLPLRFKNISFFQRRHSKRQRTVELLVGEIVKFARRLLRRLGSDRRSPVVVDGVADVVCLGDVGYRIFWEHLDKMVQLVSYGLLCRLNRLLK